MAAAICLFPTLLAGQGSGRDALSMFPADTQEFAYSNLAQLRAEPDYQVIQARLLNSQLRGFTDFLRSVGVDPDKDVDEVTLGWHGSPIDPSAYYGLASGRFDPGKVHDFFVQQNLRWQQYGGFGFYVYAAGGGARRPRAGGGREKKTGPGGAARPPAPPIEMGWMRALAIVVGCVHGQGAPVRRVNVLPAHVLVGHHVAHHGRVCRACHDLPMPEEV